LKVVCVYGNKKTFLIPKIGKVSVRDYRPQDYASPEPGPELIEPTPVPAK
jgi:hypothetical protein